MTVVFFLPLSPGAQCTAALGRLVIFKLISNAFNFVFSTVLDCGVLFDEIVEHVEVVTALVADLGGEEFSQFVQKHGVVRLEAISSVQKALVLLSHDA